MPSVLIKYVKDLAVFLIVQAFVGILAPNTAYKKYIDLVSGLVMIYLLLSPINAVLKNTDTLLYAALPEINLKLNRQSSSNQNAYLDDARNKMVLNTYKEELAAQIKTLAEREGYSLTGCEIQVNETEEDYGLIEGISLTVRQIPSAGGSRTGGILRVESVQVKIPGSGNEGAAESGQAEETNNLKKEISDFYNLSAANIHITVQKN